jgi:sugar (pentulose or hexulose) kinase
VSAPLHSGHLIGIDLGTSAIKAVRTDAGGTVLAEACAATELLVPRAGWVEVEPEALYRNLCRVVREVAQASPAPVAGLALAAASGNTLLCDEAGVPLGRVINWMDRRAEEPPLAALHGLTEAEVRQVTGWPCLGSFPLAHLAWLTEHEPARVRSAAHAGMDTDWLTYRLTGRWRLDHSTATPFHLQDQCAGAYHAPFLKRLGLRREQLSGLTDSGVAIGPLTGQAAADTGLSARTIVATGSFDHPAAARAVGVLAPGQLLLSCGTSWVGLLPHADRQALVAAELLCDPFLSRAGGPWAGMFSVPRIGTVIDGYVREVIAPGEAEALRVFDARASEAEPGAGGLRIDLREPPRCRTESRADVARAVMEGAARLLAEKLEVLRAHGFRYQEAVMVGGASRSPVWPGIVSELTGLNVVSGGRSAGARGAALLAGLGAGLYPDERAALRAWRDQA